jgi:hypothetical protein
MSAKPRSRVLFLLLRNSPWLSMAALLHVLVFTVLSVVYLTHERTVRRQGDLAVNLAAARPELPKIVETTPEILVRSNLPKLTTERRESTNLEPVYLPDAIPNAAPGKAGEITGETDPTREAGIFNPDPEALSELPSGATGGTPIGVGAVGHRSTGTSAFSSRIPGANGRGGGGRGDGGGNGVDEMGSATDAALVWLQNHQAPDGRWGAASFAEQCKKNECSGRGNPVNDVGLTGLALLCFLGAGETHELGVFRDTVKRGLLYLLSEQAEHEDGCFGERVGQHWIYDHACATLAMAEAYGMTGAKAFKDSALLGIRFVLRAQNPYAAWRYAYPPDGDNDTSVTGWMVMGLKSAGLAGLPIDEAALTNARVFIEELTDPVSGRTGYTALGEMPSRLPGLRSAFPSDKSESLTAVGMLVRIFGGRTPENDPLIAKGADLLVKKLPRWDTTDGSIDFYYWYYGTLAMHQVGGARWEKWNEALKPALIDHQRLDPNEDEYGSWDPLDPWSAEGGRVYATALNCLSTEVYYRYPRVFGAKAHGK